MAAVVAAIVLLLVGSALAVAGIFLLAGPGWALVAGSVPLVAVSVVLMRGLSRVRG